METSVNVKHNRINQPNNKRKNCLSRFILEITAVLLAVVSLMCSCTYAHNNSTQKATSMKPKAFVYTELQISVPFNDVPWPKINNTIKQQPGFLNKTWLAGVGNNSAGGFYAFDSIENAQRFVTHYFPQEANNFGVAQSTKIFDASATELASRDINSMHYEGKMHGTPGAFVYTEVQVHAIPFTTSVQWSKVNQKLKDQQGLLAKTWLSGVHTGTPGGFYAFDTIENAQKFVSSYFPKQALELNAAFTTKIFNAKLTERASQAMNSPFYKPQAK